MDPLQLQSHWDSVYATQAPDAVSWYQRLPARALALIAEAGATKATRLIDVGGGDSTLVDAVLDRGWGRPTVLDISAAALARAKARLGARAGEASWIEADVTHAPLAPHTFDVWHDRAVFHFLVERTDRVRYVETMRRTLVPGGYAVIATFAADGPTRCSGLPVARYHASALHQALGNGFTLVSRASETHHTPSGSEQRFTYCLFRMA